jgi:hypothetical protein
VLLFEEQSNLVWRALGSQLVEKTGNVREGSHGGLILQESGSEKRCGEEFGIRSLVELLDELSHCERCQVIDLLLNIPWIEEMTALGRKWRKSHVDLGADNSGCYGDLGKVGLLADVFSNGTRLSSPRNGLEVEALEMKGNLIC